MTTLNSKDRYNKSGSSIGLSTVKKTNRQFMRRNYG